MKKTVKMIFQYLCYGICLGCTFFVVTNLIGYAISGETFLTAIKDNFVGQALGSMLVGIACGSTSVVYQLERPSWRLKTVIHFVVGMGVFYPTAIYMGWIPFFPERILYTVIQILISCGIFMAIWFCFYLANRGEAKKINARLRELEEKDGETKP